MSNAITQFAGYALPTTTLNRMAKDVMRKEGGGSQRPERPQQSSRPEREQKTKSSERSGESNQFF